MGEREQDRWARWVLSHSNSGERCEFRDRVLDNADIRKGDVVLDVGTGDGLIAFGALERVGTTGRVLFSDVSAELVEHCRQRAEELGVGDRCQFIVASADNLAPVPDGSVDVVTTRSVLIYVTDKLRAFREFVRALRPGGRLSIFEPINSFGYPEPDDRFIGYDVGPVVELARKVKAVYERIQPSDDPMLDFDERDLVLCAEDAGFVDIRLTLELSVTNRPWSATPSWDDFMEMSGNPRLPVFREVLDEALTSGERDRFAAHLRPLVESGTGQGRLASAYLRAAKRS